jgi:hypothetical protein
MAMNKNVMNKNTAGHEALERLFSIAMLDTGQSRRAANFLLAWHNAEENGGWDPTDLWGIDDQIAGDMLAVLQLVRERHVYAEELVIKLGFRAQMQAVWERWRGGPVQSSMEEADRRSRFGRNS